MTKKYHSLSRRLVLTIMFLAAPIFILALGILYMQSRYLIHQETMESLESQLNTTTQRIVNYMQTVETAAESNAWMMEDNFTPDAIEAVCDRIVRLNGNVVSSSVYALPHTIAEYDDKFSVYTEKKDTAIVTYREPEYDYKDKLCYTKTVETGKAGWVDPFIEYTEGKVDYRQAIATYCKPLRRHNGRMIGVVTVDMSFSRLAKMLNEDINADEKYYYVLLSEDGRYLAHPDTTRLFRKSIFADVDPNTDSDIISLGYEMTSGKHGALRAKYNGKNYYILYQPVTGTKWSIALACSDSHVMKSYRKLCFIVVVLVILGLLAIIWLSNRMVKHTIRPINRLLDMTKNIANGQFDEQIPATSRKGVIARLQNSFAQMQMALNGRMHTLRQNAEDIRQRNEALEQAIKQADDNVKKKNQFMQQVSQHMRSPLNVITGFASMLRESSANKSMISAEELANISNVMKSNTINLNSMVLMLFDASESDANEALKCKRNDEVSVNSLAHECIVHTQTHIPNVNIELTSTVSNTLCILTNHYYVMRALRELLYNAAKYSDGQHVKLIITETDNTVRYVVEDVGPGLSEGMKEQLFNPFTREGDLSEGLGLGLPLARRHAKSLGGDLVIDTEYHQGCRIILELPK